MRRSLARGAIVSVATLCLVAAPACSKSEPASQSVSEPAATATTSPTASSAVGAPPPAFDPAATPTPAPAPVVIVPPEEPSPSPQATTTSAPRHSPAVPKALPPESWPAKPAKPRTNKPDDDGLHATPAPNLGVKKVAVLANNHYTCSSTEKRDNVAAFAEPRGARIAIVGQGPCPGEVHDWSAQVTQQRVEVHGTHGAASKCRCVGSGELVLRGLDPGTYEIAVNGGFDRPIATRITVLQ